jgi:membrane protein implicated in regulation of membrane protease activity
MEIFGEFLLELNPWWFAAIGLLLIVIDGTILSSGVFLFLGISVFLLLAPRMLTESPFIMSWSFPAALFISYVGHKKLMKILFRNSEQFNPGEKIIGREGKIIEVHNSNASTESFYAYKANIPHEVTVTQKSDVTLRVTLDDGKILPITNPSDLKVNEVVQVVDFDGINATVRRKQSV